MSVCMPENDMESHLLEEDTGTWLPEEEMDVCLPEVDWDMGTYLPERHGYRPTNLKIWIHENEILR